MRFASLLLAFSLAAHGVPAAAWGPEGHRVIARVAQHYLTPEARRGVDALLALEPHATLVSISTWADRTRDPGTAAWHYLNLPREAGCTYVAARDCPGGHCVVGAIEAQVQRLGSAAPPRERLEALKYVVHFVADVHQPLHVGFKDDRGGNTYQLQAFGKGTNLHAVWDSGLIRAIDPSASALAGQLLDRAAAAGSADAGAIRFAPAQWARESCSIVSRADFYPGRRLADSYLAAYEPVVRQRLHDAGLRLAATLNRVFDPPAN